MFLTFAGMRGTMSASPMSMLSSAPDEFRENPYPLLAMLREHQPLAKTPLGLWAVTRYADVERLLRGVAAGMRRRDGTPFVIPDVPPDAPIDPNDFMLLRTARPTRACASSSQRRSRRVWSSGCGPPCRRFTTLASIACSRRARSTSPRTWRGSSPRP
jgi:hypothetical protein